MNSYVMWAKCKAGFEQLCAQKELYQQILLEEDHSSEQFAAVQADVKRFALLHSAATSILQTNSTQFQRESYLKAKTELELLCDTVQQRYNQIVQQGPLIEQSIERCVSVGPSQQEEEFFRIVSLCGSYSAIENFDSSLLTKRTPVRQMYADLGTLLYLGDVKNNLMERGTNANTSAALEELHLETKTIITQSSLIQRLIREKHKKSLSTIERQFLDLPIPFFHRYAQDLSVACEQSGAYLSRKESIEKGNDTLQEFGQHVMERPITVDKADIQYFSVPAAILPSPFDKLSLLKPLISSYSTLRVRVESVTQQRITRLNKVMGEEAQEFERELTTIYAGKDATDYSERVVRLDVLSHIASELNLPIIARIQGISDKYRRLQAMASIHSSPRVEVSVRKYSDNIGTVTEGCQESTPEQTNESVKFQLPCATLIADKYRPVPSDKQVMEKIELVQEGLGVKGQDVHPRKVQELELSYQHLSIDLSEHTMMIAFQSMNTVSDPDLRTLCQIIAGYDGKTLQLSSIQQRERSFPLLQRDALNDFDKDVYDKIMHSRKNGA